MSADASSGAKIRAFVALDLDDRTREAFAEQMHVLRTHSHHAWRWVEPDMMHVTLAFLGGIPAEQVAPISEALAALAPRAMAPALRQATLTAFPGERRARILVFELADDDGGCARIAAEVATALEPHGYVPEARAFRPHVTLARTREPFDARGLTRELPPISLADAPLRTLTLYRSVTGPSGAHYTPLARFPLAISPAT